jgi:uncharacterized protein
MKIVVDTNVLVSAVIKNNKPEKVIHEVIKTHEWLASPDILQEYQDVLSRKKFNLTKEMKQTWFNLLSESVVLVNSEAFPVLPRDPADTKFLACAFTAEADFLVTGDNDFTEARAIGKTKIISVDLLFIDEDINK